MPPSTDPDPLPTFPSTRWVARRKALLVAAVRSGKITLEEARRRYALSIEEFVLWQRTLEREGLAGLRATGARSSSSRRASRSGNDGAED